MYVIHDAQGVRRGGDYETSDDALEGVARDVATDGVNYPQEFPFVISTDKGVPVLTVNLA